MEEGGHRRVARQPGRLLSFRGRQFAFAPKRAGYAKILTKRRRFSW